MRCFVCKSETEKLFIYDGPDPYREVLDSERWWFKCSNCQALCGERVPDIEKFYSENYYDIQLNDISGVQNRFQKIMDLPPEQSDNVQRVIRVISELNRWSATLSEKQNEGGRLLDIGSGFGVFPARFRESCSASWDIDVVEPGATACRFLEELGFTTHEGCFGDTEIPGKFHLITLNRVLEHVLNPYELLCESRQKLNDQGFIYIEVPDVLTLEIYGNRDDQFASTHYVIYTPLALMEACDKAGLEILTMQRVKEPSGKLTLYAFLRKSK